MYNKLDQLFLIRPTFRNRICQFCFYFIFYDCEYAHFLYDIDYFFIALRFSVHIENIEGECDSYIHLDR